MKEEHEKKDLDVATPQLDEGCYKQRRDPTIKCVTYERSIDEGLKSYTREGFIFCCPNRKG